MADTFCKAPWSNISIDPDGSVLPCCRIENYHYQADNLQDMSLAQAWNGPAIRKVRKQFLDGEIPIACINPCFKVEEAGMESYRQVRNSWDIDIVPSVWSPPPVFFDLKTTNVCNLKCRMCCSINSSLIAKEEGDDNTWWTTEKLLVPENRETFISWIDKMMHIGIAGGEPFVNPETKKILDAIIKSGRAKKIEYGMNTNGMFWIQSFIDQIVQFKRARISISIDDLYQRNEYSRANSVWDTIARNLKKYVNLRDTHDHIKINSYATVNNYSIWYLEEYFQYFENINVLAEYQPLIGPFHMNISYLSADIKDQILNKYQNTNNKNIKDLMKFMMTQSEQDFTNKFIAYNKQKDKVRNENFKDVFPEWSKVINYE